MIDQYKSYLTWSTIQYQFVHRTANILSTVNINHKGANIKMANIHPVSLNQFIVHLFC